MPENQDDQRLDELLRNEFADLSADRLGADQEIEIDDEELAAYVAGELNEEQQGDLQRRMEGSPEAVQRLLDLEELMAPVESPVEPTAGGVVDFETAAAWRALAPQLDGIKGHISTQDRSEAQERTSDDFDGFPAGSLPPQRWLSAVAALLAFCVLGLGWQNLRLSGLAEDLRDQLTSASPNVPLVYFDSNRSGDGSRDGGGRLEEDDSGWVVLMLGPYPGLGAEQVQAVVRNASGVVWSGSLEVPELGAARLGLPRQLLPAGDYQVQVTVGEEMVAEHSLVSERRQDSAPTLPQ